MKSVDISKIGKLMYNAQFRKSLMNYSDNITFPGKPENVKFNVVKNTRDTFYFAIPENNSEVSIDNLSNVSAAGAFTVSTAGSVGTVTSTVSTAGSAGTALVVNGKTY